MRTLIITITLALAASHAAAQDSPTRALVEMIVAEQYCGIDAPERLTLAMGERASLETGMDMQKLVDASYMAANAMGRDYALSGKLGLFCRRVSEIYGAVR